MKFPWNKYIELPTERRNTLQIFITNSCNLNCTGCFARKVMKDSNQSISLQEYIKVIEKFVEKGGKQVNLLGGEPLLHAHIQSLIQVNVENGLKTTIYTNGYYLDRFYQDNHHYLYEHLNNASDDLIKAFDKVKLRVSIYSKDSGCKNLGFISSKKAPFDANFMVSSKTTVEELLETAKCLEEEYNTNVFFISSLRELDNDRQEFFDDTDLTMPILEYKELVHSFLDAYEGNMDIHVSKRGVFESVVSQCGNKCRFSNYFIGGKIIQCPYDVVNLKYQDDYEFDKRFCRQNNSCLMSKVIYRKNK